MGCTKINRTYNFSFKCEKSEVSLLIYDSDACTVKTRVDMDERYKTGDIFSCVISGVGLDKCLYCYECDGKKVTDPYSKTVTGCINFGDDSGDGMHLSRVSLDMFDWEDDHQLCIPADETIIYKMNVRGFTKSRTSGVKHKGTFAGIIEKIPYLKKLGITTIELMPAYEFDEVQRFEQFKKHTLSEKYKAPDEKKVINYWGYTDAFHFAPKAAFSSVADKKSDYTVEFKRMVKNLHDNNIEVIMEMYFTDETPDMILDCVRYWVIEYHIDGIHLYTRYDSSAFEILADDALLAKTKLITVYYNGQKKKYKNIYNYESGFANIARRFLKGDENQLAAFSQVIKNNPPQSADINYITNHNGFTLMDLVSYDRKHNELNGEANRDGEDFNHSWNCGHEGRTRQKKVLQLRRKQIKNAFMILLLSQATPLILAGDEFENTQMGNNNPYCIDDETSWLNWRKSDSAKELFSFVCDLIDFRKKNKVLHLPEQLRASDYLSCGYPDVSYHADNAWFNAMEPFNRHMAVMYCGEYANVKNLIYVAYNMHWEPHLLALPKLPAGYKWNVRINSSDDKNAVKINADRTVMIDSRCVAVLVGEGRIKEKDKKIKNGKQKN